MEHNGEISLAKQDSQPSLSVVALTCLGFACYSICSVFGFSPSLYLQPSAEAQQVISSVMLLNKVFGIAILVAVALYSHHHGPLLTKPWIIVVTGLLYSGGYFAIFFSGYNDAFLYFGLIFGTVLKAFGVVSIVLWCEVLSLSSIKTMAATIASGYLICFAAVSYFAHNESLSTTVVISALPLVSMAALLLLARESHMKARSKGNIFKDLPLKQFLAIGILGAAQLLINVVSEQRVGYSVELNTVIAGGIASFVLLALFLFEGNRFGMVLLSRLLVPILIIGMLLVLIAEPGFQKYESYAIGAGYAVYRIFLVSLWCYFAQRSPLNVAVVVALGQAIQLICNLLEKPVESLFLQSGFPQSAGIAIIIVVTLVAALFMLGEHDITNQPKEAIAKKEPFVDTLENSNSERIAVAAQRFGFTQRERDICLLLMKGKTTDEVCAELFISSATFKTHMRNIYGKAKVHRRSELIALLGNLRAETFG